MKDSFVIILSLSSGTASVSFCIVLMSSAILSVFHCSISVSHSVVSVSLAMSVSLHIVSMPQFQCYCHSPAILF